MRTSSYLRRRDQLTTYFDQTAAAAWQALTSTDPVNRIRATVRAGRDDMRATLMSWLPKDLTGKTLLDAGCGTGALAVEAAKRGAHVVAIDVASNLVDVARKRAAEEHLEGSIDFRVGDMLADAPATVDYTVALSPPYVAFAESPQFGGQRMVALGGMGMTSGIAGEGAEIFNLSMDPTQLVNLADSEGDKLEVMIRHLQAWEKTEDLDEETLKQLKSLGYIQ